jgi:hypothetical protein
MSQNTEKEAMLLGSLLLLSMNSSIKQFWVILFLDEEMEIWSMANMINTSSQGVKKRAHRERGNSEC